jgi:hypothetical protein
MDTIYGWVSVIKFNIINYGYGKADGLKWISKLHISLSLKLRLSCKI